MHQAKTTETQTCMPEELTTCLEKIEFKDWTHCYVYGFRQPQFAFQNG